MNQEIAKRHVALVRKEAAYAAEIEAERLQLGSDDYDSEDQEAIAELVSGNQFEQKTRYNDLRAKVGAGIVRLLHSPASENLVELEELTQRRYTSIRAVNIPGFDQLDIVVMYDQTDVDRAVSAGDEEIVDAYVKIGDLPMHVSRLSPFTNLVHLMPESAITRGQTTLSGEIDRLHSEFQTLQAIHAAAGLTTTETPA